MVCAWLSSEDYARALRSADVGVCLHMSTSGVDLPMKIIDMFACELPVCLWVGEKSEKEVQVLAHKYKSIGELVNVGENGQVFEGAQQLTHQLQTLLTDFPHG